MKSFLVRPRYSWSGRAHVMNDKLHFLVATADGRAGSGISAEREETTHAVGARQALAQSTQCQRGREVAAAAVNGVNQLLSSPNLKANLTTARNRELSGRSYASLT
jgi:hypothetical protein